MRKNFFWFILVSAFIAGSLFVSCSNGSDGGDSAPVVTNDGMNTGGGGTNPTTTTPDTYTVTFNANDGSQSPTTATQNFTAGTPQALKTVAELGFSKSGFNFAGWGTSADASESSYADGNSYTATSDAILYALWSVIPIYRVKTSENEHGTVTATPATATAGTKITLSNTPNAGYQFVSYTVTDADGKTITVANGKFIMPAKNVTVTATFDAINYNINVGIFTNGSVTASPTTATLGTSVTLAISPASGYKLGTLAVTDTGNASVLLSGTGNTRTFTMPAKNVNVTATFVALPPAASGAYTKTGTTTINNIKYDLVTFGLWPQTIKAANVDVSDQCESKTVGEFTYYKGNDGQWYAKIKEGAYDTGYKYSDGTAISQSSADSYKWFKVEPIKWRVLTTDYKGTGKKLLHAENILIAKRYDVSKNNYQNSEVRKWLNSNANSVATSDYGDSSGFLKTAFTDAELAKIADTSVDNSARSTNPDGSPSELNGGANQYAGTPTTDKVFLLSVQEANKNGYGFGGWNASRVGSRRICVTTDYAKACGANLSQIEGEGSTWWLRSPCFDKVNSARCVAQQGGNSSANVFGNSVGVVPALCVNN